MLIAGNKTVQDLPKFGGNLQGKREIFMHHILENCTNYNCDFYHAQAREIYAQYAENLCIVLATVMKYIWRHGEADIKVPSPVGSKRKREG